MLVRLGLRTGEVAKLKLNDWIGGLVRSSCGAKEAASNAFPCRPTSANCGGLSALRPSPDRRGPTVFVCARAPHSALTSAACRKSWPPPVAAPAWRSMPRLIAKPCERSPPGRERWRLPVSSSGHKSACCRVLEAIVGHAILPCSPEDAQPSASEDAHGMRMLASSSSGVLINFGGPRAWMSGVVCKAGDGGAQAFVVGSSPGDAARFTALISDGRDAGLGGEMILAFGSGCARRPARL